MLPKSQMMDRLQHIYNVFSKKNPSFPQTIWLSARKGWGNEGKRERGKEVREWGNTQQVTRSRRASSYSEFHQWNTPSQPYVKTFTALCYDLHDLTWLPSWPDVMSLMALHYPSFPQLSLSLYDLTTNKFEGMRDFLAKNSIEKTFSHR